MLNLPPEIVTLKNKLYSTGAALILLEVKLQGLELTLVANEVQIEWNNKTWVPFPFEINNVGEAKRGEIPSITVRVSNVTRAIQAYIDEANGGIDAKVSIYVVHSEHLDKAEMVRLDFSVISTNATSEWVIFTLSSINTLRQSAPKHRYNKNFCRFKFKDPYCNYQGAELVCDKSLSRCRELENSERFGGFPGIGFGGINL